MKVGLMVGSVQRQQHPSTPWKDLKGNKYSTPLDKDKTTSELGAVNSYGGVGGGGAFVNVPQSTSGKGPSPEIPLSPAKFGPQNSGLTGNAATSGNFTQTSRNAKASRISMQRPATASPNMAIGGGNRVQPNAGAGVGNRS
jgi:hypothetical protein